MLLDRHRVARLIELSALERTLRGPERLLREQDVALLIKAAYDDASEAARAAFMARVQRLPTSAWPWSSVQAMPTTAAHGDRSRVVGVPRPSGPTTPAAVVLIGGQVDSADADPGNRLPERSTPEGAEWDALHRALDAWDTQTISRWIGPQGWVTPRGTTAGQVPQNPEDDATDRPPADGLVPGSGTGSQPTPPSTPAFTWRHPGVIAAGATVASTVGVVLFGFRHRAQDEPAKEES